MFQTFDVWREKMILATDGNEYVQCPTCEGEGTELTVCD